MMFFDEQNFSIFVYSLCIHFSFTSALCPVEDIFAWCKVMKIFSNNIFSNMCEINLLLKNNFLTKYSKMIQIHVVNILHFLSKAVAINLHIYMTR